MRNSSASWSWATLCCPSLLSSPRSSPMEVRSTSSSGTLLRSDVNSTVSLTERNGAVECLVVDVAHAFRSMPIRPSERQFMSGKVGTRFLDFKVFSTRGTSSPNIWSWFAAAIGRVVSSVFSGDEFRCDICVDDASWALEVALMKDNAPSLPRCCPSLSWCGSGPALS